MNGIPTTKGFEHALEVSRLLLELKCPWGIARGWAVDLYLIRVTRQHHDIEVAIFRDDQLEFQRYLLIRNWSMTKVINGQFHPWMEGKRLSLPVREIWCGRNEGA